MSNFADNSVIIINDGSVNANSLLAVRNLKNTKFVSNDMLTAKDLFYAKAILIDVASVKAFSKELN